MAAWWQWAETTGASAATLFFFAEEEYTSDTVDVGEYGRMPFM
jgi:hypothetical protein